MARRILIAVVIVMVATFFYFGYANYDAGRTGANGDVYSNDASGKMKLDTGAGSAEGKGSAGAGAGVVGAGAVGTGAVGTGSTAATPGTPAVVFPAVTPQGAIAAAVTPGEQVTRPGAAGTGKSRAARGAAPAEDSISPNPPNGMAFAGTGKYQVYRQGNLTWRLNTTTGQSCVLFATDEEWKKSKVLRAGCGGRQ